ncbi:polynucleotide 3'-phosphatase [Saccharomyces eubayanus]|uniref:polynucleotide 3'-phosphatase n=1 Tax=Saccharomyces eubayanus TaxID=1080349 RepID=UPI0006C4A8EC|nr:TPP1-like protein [Saccharomyces eubayanus]KOG97488.1 TPP1-like protein [Saccharomyces eubayanus]
MSHKSTILPCLIKFMPISPLPLSKDDPCFNVYAFDLDHTIIKPKSPNSKFSRNADDWQFMSFNSKKSTLDYLFDIIEKDPIAIIVVFSNQGGVVTVPRTSKSCTKYTNKISLVLKAIKCDKRGDSLLSRLWLYAAPKRSKALVTNKNKFTFPRTSKNDIDDPKIYEKVRKPMTGMADFFERDIHNAYGVSESPPITTRLNWIYYCGDAAGRKKDFSDSDKKFAENLNVVFKYPEEVFQGC